MYYCIFLFILGFGARGPTDAERVVGNFYGNQGNQPSFYRDPVTGELVESAMQGYNISSAFGKGIPAAIDKRLARIGRTIQKKKGKVTQGLLDLQTKLKAEKEALAAAELKQLQNKARQMGFQGDTRTQGEKDFADTQTYGGGGTMNDLGADNFI